MDLSCDPSWSRYTVLLVLIAQGEDSATVVAQMRHSDPDVENLSELSLWLSYGAWSPGTTTLPEREIQL